MLYQQFFYHPAAKEETSMKGDDSAVSAVHAGILPTGYNWKSTEWVQPMWITVKRHSVHLQLHVPL